MTTVRHWRVFQLHNSSSLLCNGSHLLKSSHLWARVIPSLFYVHVFCVACSQGGHKYRWSKGTQYESPNKPQENISFKGSKPLVTSSLFDVAAIDFFLCICWPDSDLIDYIPVAVVRSCLCHVHMLVNPTSVHGSKSCMTNCSWQEWAHEIMLMD